MDSEALGELWCWELWGRGGALAKMLSSELVSVEDGRVEVDPCWALLYGRDEENWVPLLDLLSLISELVGPALLLAWTMLLTALRTRENLPRRIAHGLCRHLCRSR